jgi:Tol biopolymer transport system component
MRKMTLKIAVGIGLLLSTACTIITDGIVPTPQVTIPVSTSNDSRIVFVKNIYGKFEGLYIMDPQGNNVSRIPNVCLTRFVSPAWSPTGEWIAFGCQNGKGEQNLCVSDVDGQTPDKISLSEISGCYSYQGLIDRDQVPDQFCAGAIQSVTWSPDGNQLAVGCQGSVCVIDLDGVANCWTLSGVIGKEDLADGIVTIDWSPTSDTLVMAARHLIYMVDVNGTEAHFLVEGWSPRWSPDGNRLAFFQPEALCVEKINNGGRECYSLDGNDPSLVVDWEAPPRFLDGRIAWSPTAKSVVFSAGQTTSGWPTAIYVFEVEERIIRQITLSFDGNFSYPDWSPK